MLVEFVVQNFRSIRDDAKKPGEHPEAVAVPRDPETGVEPKTAIGLLKTATIYGPNNAGKSNLIRAVQAMQHVVGARGRGRNADSNALAGLVPYRLDPVSLAEPSMLEVTFMIGAAKYRYGFAADQKQVHEEWLHAWPSGGGQHQVWFERSSPTYDPATWYFGPKLGGKTRSLSDAFTEDQLFLSVGRLMRNTQLMPVADWITRSLRVHDFTRRSNTPLELMNAKSRMAKDPNFTAWLTNLLKTSDLRIDDLNLAEEEDLTHRTLFDAKEDDASVKPNPLPASHWMRRRIEVPRRSGEDTEYFDLEQDESSGTRRLVAILTRLYSVLESGGALIVDELEASLHVLQVKRLVELMQDSQFNPSDAQLVFTSHQALLLDPEVFRRDQIYLMGCDAKGASSLASLLDFKARKNEAWCKGYLAGRYGAVPYLRPLMGDSGATK